MNITKSTETRTVLEIRYVGVTNMAAIEIFSKVGLLAAGVAQVKVTKLTKGGYSVRPLGPNAIASRESLIYNRRDDKVYLHNEKTHYTSGDALLRVDNESVYLADLFKD